MTEIFPVSAGVIVGLATFQLPSSALRWGVLGVLGIALGVAASVLSGELAVGWWFALVDIGQVLLAGAITWTLCRRSTDRTARRGQRPLRSRPGA
jgi:hypothetical protein